jgi:hypothetical protein
MTNLETVAAQRDELAMKNRELSRKLDATNAEIARLKGEEKAPPGVLDVAPIPVSAGALVPPVPSVGPPKAKRARVFGGG